MAAQPSGVDIAAVTTAVLEALIRAGVQLQDSGRGIGAAMALEDTVGSEPAVVDRSDGGASQDGLSGKTGDGDEVVEDAVDDKPDGGGGFVSGVGPGVLLSGLPVVEDGDGAVVMPRGGIVGSDGGSAVLQVKFGGLADIVGEPEVRLSEPGFMATYVRVQPVLALQGWLRERFGIRMPQTSRVDLALVRYTAGTVPTAFVDGQMKIRGYALTGDRAVKMLLAAYGFSNGLTVQKVTEMEAKRQSDSGLRDSGVSREFLAMVLFAPGVAPEHSKSASTAVEALLGVVAFWRPLADVAKLAMAFGAVPYFQFGDRVGRRNN